MMDSMMMGKEQHHEGDYSGGQWVDMGAYHQSHVHSPAHEYGGYGFMSTAQHSGLPLEPTYNRSMPPLYSGSQPQPITTQWPSMLTNPSSQASRVPPIAAPPPQLAPVVPLAPAQPLPPLTTAVPAPATTTTSNSSSSTTRRTLTDQDRRRMCQYHEDNPTIKQTEIGAMFGVERSTVSKVLRQKEKYLCPDDGGRSPIKRSKGKFPDIERALSNWARNHQRQGLPLNDNMIRDKARFFAATVGSSESHVKVNSSSWLEKFKQKNHLMGSKPRKASDAAERDLALRAGSRSGVQTPSEISPMSPAGLASPSPISPSQSRDNLKNGSRDDYVDFAGDYKHAQSQSATTLPGEFGESTASTSFSPQTPSSPFFADVNGSGSPYIGVQHLRPGSTSAANVVRPRSQTVPMLTGEPGFSTHSGADGRFTPKQVQEIMAGPALDTPIDDYPDRSLSASSADLQRISSQPSSDIHSPLQDNSPALMAPPPNPLVSPATTNDSTMPSPIGSPSQDDARRALELVMNYFQNQPTGVVDPQEYIMMGKLMEKLKVQGSVGELPGGMHSIDYGQKEMSRKRSIHSL